MGDAEKVKKQIYRKKKRVKPDRRGGRDSHSEDVKSPISKAVSGKK